MANEWLNQMTEESLGKGDLLQLYKLFQDRQIADLDMLHKYANYYVAALLAMLAALAIGLTRAYDTPVAGALIALPVVSFMLSQQGKLMAFRFYRRYNEGRVRLTKIEYLLGLLGPIASKEVPQNDLWPKDKGFLSERYRIEADKEPCSIGFVHRRSTLHMVQGYGAGYIVQMTFNVFSGLFALAVIGLPACLYLAQTSHQFTVGNFLLSGVSVLILVAYMVWYRRVLYHMQSEGVCNSILNSQPCNPADCVQPPASRSAVHNG